MQQLKPKPGQIADIFDLINDSTEGIPQEQESIRNSINKTNEVYGGPPGQA